MAHDKDPIVIVGSARTPIGNLLGTLSPFRAQDLGAIVIQSAITRAKLKPEDIDEVIMGCVLAAGLGQAPARQAAVEAKIPYSCGATTLNKMCGSGMKAVMLAHDLLSIGSNHVMVAGGMESMTNAPYLLDRARMGYRMGNNTIRDHMFLDGLEDAFDRGKLMGVFAEETAAKYKLSRQDQDEFATTSLNRAKEAIKNGWFHVNDIETITLTIKLPNNEISIKDDEQPQRADVSKISQLRPAFKENGTITAATSSSISDGAAALVLMRASEAKKRGLTPIAKIMGHATHSQESQLFTTAPVKSIQKLLEAVGWKINDVDLFEINEAFAVVPLIAMKELKIPHDKLNIHGGACALGHPIGASGARIITTLLGALKRIGKEKGVASVCIGGGEATSIAIEML